MQAVFAMIPGWRARLLLAKGVGRRTKAALAAEVTTTRGNVSPYRLG